MNCAVKLRISLLACLLAFATGCGGLSLTKNVGSSTASESAGAAEIGSPVPSSNRNEVLIKAYRNLLSARSYRAHCVMEMAGGGSISTTTEYAAPDYLYVVKSGDDKEPNFKMETLVVGGATYMRVGNSKWDKTQINVSEAFTELHSEETIEQLLKTYGVKDNNIKIVGQENVNDIPTTVYEVTVPMPGIGGDKSEAVNKYWIGSRDNMIYQTEIQEKTNGGVAHLNMKITTTYSDYGAVIKKLSPM